MEFTKRSRKNPIRVYYAGMELLIGTYKSNHRIDISYKAAGMKQTFTREYTPIVNDPNLPPPATQAELKTNTNESSDASIETETTSVVTLQVGEYPSEQVIQWTLQEKLSKYFLPALFKEHPTARNGSIHLAVIGPYALQKLHVESSSLKQSTKDTEKKSLQRMIQLWGDIPLVELTPKYCEYDLVHKMAVTPGEECIRLMRKLYPNVVLGTITDAFVWTNYCHPERRRKYIPKRRVRSVPFECISSSRYNCTSYNSL